MCVGVFFPQAREVTCGVATVTCEALKSLCRLAARSLGGVVRWRLAAPTTISRLELAKTSLCWPRDVGVMLL